VTGLGRVTIVGGGPGDPDLLTVRAVRALASADVVLADRLGPAWALAELAPQAVVVDVGKEPGRQPVPQAEIERLLIAHARAGLHVVRLKGGDPFVFGRGSEEVLACAAAGVAVTVVPGLSSALAAPALAGIPLTHRGLARGFTVVTGHPLPDPAVLAGYDGTIVVLMGMAALPDLVGGMLAAGFDPATPSAVIERASMHDQRTTRAAVRDLAGTCSRIGVTSPAVIVIGAVAGLGAAAAYDDELGRDPGHRLWKTMTR
jgi:uroporphyrin-III C-methyltransferase